MDDTLQEGVRLYRELLNMAEGIFDDYYETEESLPETTEDGVLKAYKSKELLEWMHKARQWVERATGQSLLKEDIYDHMKGKNPSLAKLQEEFGLEIE